MGAFALPAAFGLMAGGTVTSAVGQSQAARAAEKAGRFNAAVQQRNAEEQALLIGREGRIRESENIARIAKSGVRLSGSPLAVLTENEYQVRRQQEYVRQAGALGAQISRATARNARTAGQFGVASTVLSGAGRLGALAVRNNA